MSDNLFDKLHQNANINKESIFKVADSVKNANFKDEKVVRQLVHQLAGLSGKSVNKQMEDKIVKAVVSNNMPLDFTTLNDMFNQKK